MADIIAQGIGSAFDKIEIVSNKGYKFERNGIPNIEKLQNSFMLKKVQSKGKHIAMYLDSDEEIVVINTLNMTGTWAWNQTNHKHARINFCGRNNLTFLDQRNFGSFKIVSPKEAKKRLDLLGEGNNREGKVIATDDILNNVNINDTIKCRSGNFWKKDVGGFRALVVDIPENNDKTLIGYKNYSSGRIYYFCDTEGYVWSGGGGVPPGGTNTSKFNDLRKIINFGGGYSTIDFGRPFNSSSVNITQKVEKNIVIDGKGKGKLILWVYQRE